MTTLYDFNATTIQGEDTSLADYSGQVVLVVNTASKCGFTPQFSGLEGLYEEFKADGFVVLGFPCDQFAHQEFDDAESIDSFCRLNYGVTFPMFAKIDVNGAGAHPLFRWLRSEKGGLLGSTIKWNFTKFLIGRDGSVVQRYAPSVEPSELRTDIRTALGQVATS